MLTKVEAPLLGLGFVEAQVEGLDPTGRPRDVELDDVRPTVHQRPDHAGARKLEPLVLGVRERVGKHPHSERQVPNSQSKSCWPPSAVVVDAAEPVLAIASTRDVAARTR